MRDRRSALAVLAILAALACSRGEVDVAAPAPADLDYAGLYAVEGFTTDDAGGEQRRIVGKLIIAAGDAGAEPVPDYTTTFNMQTEYPTPDGMIQADVIGSGTGDRDETGLVGTAETQLLMAAVPGLDPKFPWIPGQLGPRVVSEFAMNPGEGGEFVIEIASRAAPGESYEPTVTTLRASRIGPAVISRLPAAE